MSILWVLHKIFVANLTFTRSLEAADAYAPVACNRHRIRVFRNFRCYYWARKAPQFSIAGISSPASASRLHSAERKTKISLKLPILAMLWHLTIDTTTQDWTRKIKLRVKTVVLTTKSSPSNRAALGRQWCWSEKPQSNMPWIFGSLKYSVTISSYASARVSRSSISTSNSVIHRGTPAVAATSMRF